jgi:hypothetical protein
MHSCVLSHYSRQAAYLKMLTWKGHTSSYQGVQADTKQYKKIFDCVIAKSMWEGISEIFGFCIGSDFNSVGQLWLSREKYIVENIFTSVAL